MKLENIKDNEYVYCKRTMITEDVDGKHMSFRQYRKYLVEVIFDFDVMIMGEQCEMVFCVDNEKDQYKFDKYFYTIKDLRKKKLDEIERELEDRT